MLGSAFVYDTITRVPKGEFGGDVLHRVVMNQTGTVCGTILWELKRTKTWSDGWLAKLRHGSEGGEGGCGRDCESGVDEGREAV
jgi:hypothetical protein